MAVTPGPPPFDPNKKPVLQGANDKDPYVGKPKPMPKPAPRPVYGSSDGSGFDFQKYLAGQHRPRPTQILPGQGMGPMPVGTKPLPTPVFRDGRGLISGVDPRAGLDVEGFPVGMNPAWGGGIRMRPPGDGGDMKPGGIGPAGQDPMYGGAGMGPSYGGRPNDSRGDNAPSYGDPMQRGPGAPSGPPPVGTGPGSMGKPQQPRPTRPPQGQPPVNPQQMQQGAQALYNDNTIPHEFKGQLLQVAQSGDPQAFNDMLFNSNIPHETKLRLQQMFGYGGQGGAPMQSATPDQGQNQDPYQLAENAARDAYNASKGSPYYGAFN